MPTLYDMTDSGNCYKVRLLLAHLGIPYDRVDIPVGASDRPDGLRAANPCGRVPAVALDDGTTLFESNAILGYFAEGTRFLPDERHERALVQAWMFWEQNCHEPYIAGSRFWKAHSGRPEVRADQYDFWTERGNEALAHMERHLHARDWFAAGRYTVADIALYAYTHVAHEGGFELGDYPAVQAWLERVAAQPGHVPLE